MHNYDNSTGALTGYNVDPGEVGNIQASDYSGCMGSRLGPYRIEFFGNPLWVKSFSGLLPEGREPDWNHALPSYAAGQPTWGWATKVIGGPAIGRYGVKLKEVTDGTSKTLLYLETTGYLREFNNPQARWARTSQTFLEGTCCGSLGSKAIITVALSPGNLEASMHDAFGGGTKTTVSGHMDGGTVAMGDASVHYLDSSIEPIVMMRLADRNDGVPVELGQ